ncbi:Plexin domain-containing protein 1, partial [Chaetura pelagica]
GTVFVVQWDKVYLQGKEDMGSFTFQAALHSSGRIVFGYKEIPVPVLQISATQHPVKAGLSDAFMVLNPAPDVPAAQMSLVSHVPWCVSLGVHLSMAPCLGCPQPRDTVCSGEVLQGERLLTQPAQHPCHLPRWCCPALQLMRRRGGRAAKETAEGGGGVGGLGVPFLQKAPNLVPFCCCFSDDTKLTQSAGSEGVPSSLPSRKASTPIHTGTIVGIVLAVLLIAVIILAGIYISSHPTSHAALFFIERRPHPCPAMKFRNHTNHSSYSEVEPGSQEKEGFVEAEQC